MGNRIFSLLIGIMWLLCTVACNARGEDASILPPLEDESNIPDGDSTLPLPEYEIPDRSTIPAFPGAFGAGRYTTGGAGGKVYTVTSLEDDGSEGTFRWALRQQEPRTIVFAVSGVIRLTSDLRTYYDNVTIAGQTAPGNGICLRDYSFQINSSNVIVRYIRCRMGDSAEQEDDAMWGRGLSNIIIDHCSMSWSTDECASFYNNSNFTMQWCILSESLTNSIHGKGSHGYGGIWGGSPATFHHNLLANHSNRTPRLDGSRSSGRPDNEEVDLRNNVIYNWASEGAYGGQGGSYNFINNYYKPGHYLSDDAQGSRSTSYYRIFTAYADDGSNNSQNVIGQYGRFYLNGNVFDSSIFTDERKIERMREVTNNNVIGLIAKDGFIVTQQLLSESPFTITSDAHEYTQTAENAYTDVLAYSGTSHKRDAIDSRIVEEVRQGTYSTVGSNGSSYGFIDTQNDAESWNIYIAEEASSRDSDGDGMPDEWEIEKRLNPNDAGDGVLYNLNPNYTNLEVYLNSLVEATFPEEHLK